jgi:diguanylate cyclase (GGDEF)-like protein
MPVKSQSSSTPLATPSTSRSAGANRTDGLGFYRLLAGIPALSTFRAKVMAVVIACTFVPTFLLVFLIVVGAGRMSGLALIASVVILAVGGAFAMAWALRRLLAPLEIAADAIDGLALGHPLPRVDLPGSDAVVQTLRGVQALVARNETLAGDAKLERDRDELTGLWSRRAGRERAQALIDRETRRGRSIRVLIADVNDFTSFNAQHGTGQGDALLKVIGERVARMAGEDGLAIRWHGDAFLLVQAASPDEALEADGLLGRPIVVRGSQAPLTLAVGTASTDERATIDALVASAEGALARARAR